MKFIESKITYLAILSIMLVFMQCEKQELIEEEAYFITDELNMENAKESEDESAGNNLSFPVIWSDGYALNLRETTISGEVTINGEWWFVWGEDPIDPQADIFSCYPSANNENLCLGQTKPGDGGEVFKSYIQKDPLNTWQADNFKATEPIYIDLIDWGDNLESIDWNIKSKVRTEIVLYENLDQRVTEYAMRHVTGWGIDEVHGLQTDLNNNIIYGPGNQATIYSHNARLTIQKLNVNREDIKDSDLYWIPGVGWSENNESDHIINEPILNMAVYNAEDGPGYYQAEVNVKGKIIYGYTWDVKKLNDDVGDYRITFSFDKAGGVVGLNTFFDEFSDVLLTEEIELEKEGQEIRGGVAVIDAVNNISYMDIRILGRSTGNGGYSIDVHGGGGHGGGGHGGGGHGGGGHTGGGD